MSASAKYNEATCSRMTDTGMKCAPIRGMYMGGDFDGFTTENIFWVLEKTEHLWFAWNFMRLILK